MWIFLDDERFPPTATQDKWKICRSRQEFEDTVMSTVIGGAAIECISFDHDLGGFDPSTTGMACAQWLISMDLECTSEPVTQILSPTFTFEVHSQNPVGAENIRALMNNYLDFKRKTSC